MKMKIFKTILFGALLTVAACDPLEQVPVSIIAESNFYQTASDAEAAILGVYDNLQWYVSNNHIIPVSARADEADVVRGGNWGRDERFESTPNDGHIRDTWTAIYSGIGRANDVIRNVPNISDPSFTEAQRDRIMGEAYFVRGFLHFMLVLRYGRIPYVTEAFISPNQEYQPTRDEIPVVYENIIEDLQQAKSLMPVDPDTKVRATKWAAAGILAKVYLQRNEPGDRELALEQINEVLNSNDYSLVPGENYSNLFTPGNQQTSETIFEVSFSPAGLEGTSYDREFVPSQNFRLQPEMSIIQAFKEDSALVASTGGEVVRMEAALEHYYPVLDENGNCILTCQVRNQYFIDKYTLDDWTKLLDRAQLHSNVIILRLADLILLKAEILNEQDDLAGATSLLNQIRDRVNLPPTTANTKDELRLAIERERWLELAFEGHRYWDLIRTGRAMDVISNKGQFSPPSAERLLWPIPQADIDQNPNLLPQNPGY
jgi:hypothetical protein